MTDQDNTQDNAGDTQDTRKEASYEASYLAYESYCQRLGITALSPMRYAEATHVIGRLYPKSKKR
jgi:hypothetical protein